ncbi:MULTISPECIES: hypothetical protein [unclassified Microcoleus]|uniref:hypothetical protein n=1 Tax=unclassified Microcoleus TaxID=2642155 RepID=UPI002FD73E62
MNHVAGILDAFGQLELAEQISLLAECCGEHLNESSPAINWRQETGGRRHEGAGGRRQEGAGGRGQKAGGRRKEEEERRQKKGGRRKEGAGGRRQEAGGRRQEAGGRRKGGRKKEPAEVFLQIGDAP